MNRFFNAGLKSTTAVLSASSATCRGTKAAGAAIADAGKSFMAGVRAARAASQAAPASPASFTTVTTRQLAKY